MPDNDGLTRAHANISAGMNREIQETQDWLQDNNPNVSVSRAQTIRIALARGLSLLKAERDSSEET